MELIVSVTLLVVSVWLVIDPWLKFGTTGTAIAGACMTPATTTLTAVKIKIFPEVMIIDLHYISNLLRFHSQIGQWQWFLLLLQSRLLRLLRSVSYTHLTLPTICSV